MDMGPTAPIKPPGPDRDHLPDYLFTKDRHVRRRPCKFCRSPARGNPCWWWLDHGPSFGKPPPCEVEDQKRVADMRRYEEETAKMELVRVLEASQRKWHVLEHLFYSMVLTSAFAYGVTWAWHIFVGR
jgi:hypothetical protein